MPLTKPRESSGGILTQLMRLFIQPVAFFRAMPLGRQWLFVALVVLVIAGYTATTQVQSTASSSGSSTTTQSTSFDLSLLDATSTETDTTATQQTQTSTTSDSTDTQLMNALLAASGVLVMWSGQALVLSLVSMLRGYPPQITKSFQIAVWASLPLALMLVLRYVHYSAGGTGGSLGLSMLLDSWTGYSTMSEYGQRIVAVFMSNLTLFWLWNVALLYLGARYALSGSRFAVLLVVVMWIVVSTLIPAFISEPETQAAPLQTTSSIATQSSDTQSSSSTTQTEQGFPSDFQGTDSSGFTGGGFPSGGNPPSGGPPGG